MKQTMKCYFCDGKGTCSIKPFKSIKYLELCEYHFKQIKKRSL